MATIPTTKAVTFPPCRPQPRSFSVPWIMRVPCVSTAHITFKDNCVLLESRPGDESHLLLPPGADDAGFLLIIEDEEDYQPTNGMSEAYATLIRHFAELGYAYLRITPDGDHVAGLELFDW